MNPNDWIEGQEIDCHENIGNMFIKDGIAIDPNNPIEEEVKQIKTKKK